MADQEGPLEADNESSQTRKHDQNDDDPPVFRALKGCGDDPEMIRNFFEIDDVGVDIEDSSGMTPLMHASWKGHFKVAKFLLSQGADVNAGNHEHGYTTLHFAGLANKPQICQLLLEKGVKVDSINTVNRTAAQMAAFVGNHECVAIINNYVPKEDVFYFTRKQPLEKEPKLPLALAQPIHSLVMLMNIHPVNVALHLKDSPELLQNIDKVCQILELMSEREFKNRRDVNEVLSFKYHMIHYIINDIRKEMSRALGDGKDKRPDEVETGDSSPISCQNFVSSFIELWIKAMLVGRENDGYQVFQENFLRQGVKEFTFQESQLFKALVMNFNHCKNYGDGVTAADYINQSLNGQKGFKDFENCDTCGNEKAVLKCSKCKAVQYCDKKCQRYHWFAHKKVCSKLAELYQRNIDTVATETSKNDKEDNQESS